MDLLIWGWLKCLSEGKIRLPPEIRRRVASGVSVLNQSEADGLGILGFKNIEAFDFVPSFRKPSVTGYVRDRKFYAHPNAWAVVIWRTGARRHLGGK